MDFSHDRDVLRRLAGEYAACAADPVNPERIRLWKRLNSRNMERPMVAIDQVCWNEFSGLEEMRNLCRDPELRAYEERLRRRLYQWKHFPADMVLEPFIRVDMAVDGAGFDFAEREDCLSTDESNQVKSHRYVNQFVTDADLDRITLPRVTHDIRESLRRLEVAERIFDGILPVKLKGFVPYVGVWDPISMWMGVEEALYALIDRPEYIHEMVRRVVAHYLSLLDQMEELGLLCGDEPLIHCTGAFTDELPGKDGDGSRVLCRDVWMFGLAQMFATVSPEMFDEFEIQPNLPIFERFGLVYYGCCDPLDGKMKQVKKIPHLRKVSVSPWAKQDRCAEELGGEYVFSRKPNPALLAFPEMDEALIREETRNTLALCREHDCPVELILKDISTVRYRPERLTRWENIVMELVREDS